jgi:hypothetical protein
MQPASAQGTPQSPYDSALSKRTKVVAVMVASGYQAQVVTLGTLLNVGRLDKTEPRDDDLLSDRVFAQLKAEMELEQRYEVRRLKVSPEQGRNLASTLWNRRDDRFGTWPRDMKEVLAKCDCDAVLIVADGPSHNTMIEAGFTFGPSFVGKSGVFGGKDVARAHFRVGLLAMLVDPMSGERIRTATVHDRPDYQDDAKAYWPGAEGAVGEVHWSRMANYLDGVTLVYRKALSMVGLRPSCAHRYFVANAGAMAARSGEAPPPPFVEDIAKCPLESRSVSNNG